jgi:hypothetical protein
MTRIITILIIFIFASCGQTYENNKIKPFEIVVYNSDYSMAYSHKYVLTEKDLKIIYKSEIEGEKDSTVFKTDLKPNENLVKLSEINIDSLKAYYSNPCIADGSQIFIKLSKDNKTKTVQLSNYYLAEIGLAIELINDLTPEKYRIRYDKATLLEEQKNCK